MPVFLRDMAQLPTSHSSGHQAFMEGNFVVQRSEKKFSMMALDQSQEHSIKFLKDDGGAKGLYGQQDEEGVIELSKPEVLRLAKEFESTSFFPGKCKQNIEHLDSAAADQKQFLKHLNSLLKLVHDGITINPFKETGPDLITLDTSEIVDPEVARSLTDAPKVGETMFRQFVEERLEKRIRPLSDVIKRPNVFTFTNRPNTDLKKSF